MTTLTTRQVHFAAPGRIEIGSGEVPEPAPREVRVRTTVVGICGTDLHALAGKHPFIDLPCSPGHEAAGIVDAIGETVEGFAVGDRVLVEPSLICGRCPRCLEGRYNICDELAVFGCQTPGAMADSFLIEADRLRQIPDGMTDAAAALVEPLSTATHAVRIAGGDLSGKQVAVLGAGSIGLLTMLAARSAGAEQVVVTDMLEEKRERAARLGASAALHAGDDVVREGREAFGGRADVVFDCVANASSLEQAMGLASKGGTVIVVGVPAGPVTLDFPMVQDREIRIEGALMYTTEDVQRAIDLVLEAAVPVNDLVTATYPLDEVAEAFRAAGSGQHLKVQLVLEP